MTTSRSTPNTVPEPLHVVAAVIKDGAGRILLAQRPAHLHLGGLWEFPGGKLEAGEDIKVGLKRELEEELGIEATSHRPLIRVLHQYPEKAVLLDVHLVFKWQGQPKGLEGQALAWVSLAALEDELRGRTHNWPMPAADMPILKALLLPERYLIATAAEATPDAYLRRLETAVASGIRLVQFRPQGLASDSIPLLWHEVKGLCSRYQARLLCNSAWRYLADGSAGLHLTSTDLMAIEQRPEGFDLVAASCHNPQELAQAVRLGLDFAVLSPVLLTTSHPDTPKLGWETFEHWVDGLPLPVYALGGTGGLDPAIAWQHGAQGIAGISGFW